MPEFTLTTIKKTDEIEIIHLENLYSKSTECNLFKSQELKNKFIEKSLDKQIDLDQTVKEVRQTKDINKSIGVHLHLIF